MELAELEPADATDFMADLGIPESGLDRVIQLSYQLSRLISFFTVGPDECPPARRPGQETDRSCRLTRVSIRA